MRATVVALLLIVITLQFDCALCKKGSVIVVNNGKGCPGGHGDGTMLVKTGKKGNTIVIKGGEKKCCKPKVVPVPIPMHAPPMKHDYGHGDEHGDRRRMLIEPTNGHQVIAGYQPQGE